MSADVLPPVGLMCVPNGNTVSSQPHSVRKVSNQHVSISSAHHLALCSVKQCHGARLLQVMTALSFNRLTERKAAACTQSPDSGG